LAEKVDFGGHLNSIWDLDFPETASKLVLLAIK
jgi:hypothetical protein